MNLLKFISSLKLRLTQCTASSITCQILQGVFVTGGRLGSHGPGFFHLRNSRCHPFSVFSGGVPFWLENLSSLWTGGGGWASASWTSEQVVEVMLLEIVTGWRCHGLEFSGTNSSSDHWCGGDNTLTALHFDRVSPTDWREWVHHLMVSSRAVCCWLPSLQELGCKCTGTERLKTLSCDVHICEWLLLDQTNLMRLSRSRKRGRWIDDHGTLPTWFCGFEKFFGGRCVENC